MTTSGGAKRFSISEAIEISAPLPSRYSTTVSGHDAAIHVRRFQADDDGTFDSDHGNIGLIFSVENTEIQLKDRVTAIRSIVLEPIIPLYAYTPDEMAGLQYPVCAFISAVGEVVEAPDDFDWWKYSNVHSDFSVHRVGRAVVDRLEVYRYISQHGELGQREKRGRYWLDVNVKHPPSGTDIEECFSALLGEVSRKGALGNNARVMSLSWTQDSEANLIIQRINSKRCYSVRVIFPTADEMQSGKFILPGSIVAVRSPFQFAAEYVSVLREFGAASTGFGGDECQC